MTPHAATATATNPYGCNQHGHKPGCPHAGGGVDPDLKQNLEAALQRARREDGTVEQGGELNRTHEVRLREMPDVMKALGEPDVPLVMTVYHIRKLAGKHGLTVEQLQEVAAKLNDPLLVMHAEQQKHLLLLDMEAYEKEDKAMRPVICFVEKKPGKTHAEYVVSAYPLQKEKYGKVIGQSDALKYVKYKDEKTAQLPAVAPQCPEARELLLAAMKGGFADSVLTWEDIVKPQKRPATDTLHAAAKPLRHEEYVPALTPDATYRTSQEWAELAPEMRAGKFFLACVEDERLLLAMHKLVDDCMQAGVSEDEFIHRAFLMLGEITDPLTGRPYYDPARRMEEMSHEERLAYDNDVQNIDARARLKLIFRTQSELAAGYTQWQKALEPDNLRRFPAWRFVRQPGARIKRPDHVAHENEVRLISDTAYWLARNSPEQGGFNQPFPPFGYNSWMRVERVSRKEAIKLGLLRKDEEPTPPPDADRWSLRQAVEQTNTASLDTLPPEAVERIKTRCREAGLELTPAGNGSYTAKPAPAAAPSIPFTDDLEEELNELMHLLGEIDTPPAPTTPTLPWLSTLFGKLLPPTDPGHTYAANPYGCNGAGHKPGCEKYTGHTNENKLQHEQRDEQPNTRPAEQPARPGDLLRQGREENGVDEKSGDPRKGAGAGVQPTRPDPHDDSGGERERAGKLVERRIGYDEAYGKVAALAPKGASEDDIREYAVIATAQFNAVLAGRKPAYLEPDVELIRAFAHDLPRDVKYIEVAPFGCIYRVKSVARELGMPPEVSVVEVEEEMKQRFATGRFGKIMGYGFDSDFERPAHIVSINENGKHITGFVASPDVATAKRYAAERLKDFKDQFPLSLWEVDVIYRPGSDSIHAANPYGCNGAGHKPGCPQKGTTREPQTKSTPRRVHKVNQTHPIHKQISALAEALERAARDGTRLEAVIYRPEFGKLILSCGSSQKNGVTHVMLPRHHISYSQVAETLLKGEVTAHPYKESRLEIKWDKYLVVLEREIKQNSHRTSKTRAKLHTAYNVVDGKE